MNSKTSWMFSVVFFHTKPASWRPMSADASTGTSFLSRGEREKRRQHPTLACDNPSLMSRLPHHQDHKVLWDYWGVRRKQVWCDCCADPTVCRGTSRWHGHESLSGTQKVSALIPAVTSTQGGVEEPGLVQITVTEPDDDTAAYEEEWTIIWH